MVYNTKARVLVGKWITNLRLLATVLELVDKHDLESCAARHVGSTPTRGTFGY